MVKELQLECEGGAERISYRVAGLTQTCSQKIHNMVAAAKQAAFYALPMRCPYALPICAAYVPPMHPAHALRTRTAHVQASVWSKYILVLDTNSKT